MWIEFKVAHTAHGNGNTVPERLSETPMSVMWIFCTQWSDMFSSESSSRLQVIPDTTPESLSGPKWELMNDVEESDNGFVVFDLYHLQAKSSKNTNQTVSETPSCTDTNWDRNEFHKVMSWWSSCSFKSDDRWISVLTFLMQNNGTCPNITVNIYSC